MMLECPNCGAPKTTPFCPYCGTPLYTPMEALSLLRGKKAHIWFEAAPGQFMLLDLAVTSYDVHCETDTYHDWTGKPVFVSHGYQEITLDGAILGYDEDAWWEHMPYFAEQTALAKPQVSGSL